MQTHSYELEGLAQANAVLTSSNSVVMAKFSKMTVTINAMQAHIKTFSLTTTNPTRTKRNFTVGYAGAILIVEVKPARLRKQATSKKHTTRSDWEEPKRGVNDG